MSAETMTTVVGVKATFSVGGSNAIHHFDSSEERMDPHPSKGNEKEDDQPSDDKYDYRYSGRHDHGPLPELKTGGLHEELINSLLEAKQDSDRFLTSVINEEKRCTESGNRRQGRGNGAGQDAAALETVPGRAEGIDVDCPIGGTERRQEEATVGFYSPEASELQPAKRPKS